MSQEFKRTAVKRFPKLQKRQTAESRYWQRLKVRPRLRACQQLRANRPCMQNTRACPRSSCPAGAEASTMQAALPVIRPAPAPWRVFCGAV